MEWHGTARHSKARNFKMIKYCDVVKKLEEHRCDNCGGTGECDDGYPDKRWTCPKCTGLGIIDKDIRQFIWWLMENFK